MKDILSFLLTVILIFGYSIFARKYVLLYGKRKEHDFEANHGKEFRRFRFYSWIFVIAFIACALLFTFIIPE